MRYASPIAFRMALEARIGQLAAGSGAAIQRLRKRVAFERLLTRLQHSPESPWILKGAFALDLRFKGRSRTTKDIDVGLDIERHAAPPDRVEVGRRLGQAIEIAGSDFFVFTIPAEGEEIIQEPAARTYRFLVQSALAGRPFEGFRLDIGVGPQLVMPADEVPESDLLSFAGIVPRTFRAFSLPQQFADKVHAFTFPWKDRENTRVKDLADLVLMLESSPPAPSLLRDAVRAVFEARGSHPIPRTLPDPPASWGEQYAAMAAEIRLAHSTLSTAMECLRAYWATAFPEE